MVYPPSPWTLQGYALQTVQLIDVTRVRSLIPSEFDILCVLPGKTLGGVYVSYYSSDSVLEYSELIIVAGIVRYSGRIGGWVSHIYVDNVDSVAGGREIWGLPKELAEFTWEKSNRSASAYENHVLVRQGEQMLCRLDYNRQKFGLQLPFSGEFFSTLSASILLFKGEFNSRIGIVDSQLQVPPESPFASLDLEEPWLTIHCEPLRLVTGTPKIVGHRVGEFSYQ